MIRYLSVCSGIEAASVAWKPLGWEPVAFSEVEKFPCSVLARHYPDVPNLGDMTQIDGEKYHGTVDLLVGGTPCQGFSVAGKRAGMADPRSGLALAFVNLVRAVSPRWIVWENVPGVLSTNYGNDFADFILALREIGYLGAWRILDAQFFGVPQRRRRVFLVGYFGDWRPAAAVLFEPDSLRGDIAPRCGTKKEIAGAFTGDAYSSGAGGRPEGASANHFIAAAYAPRIVEQAMSCKWSKGTSGPAGDEHHNLIVANTLRGECFDASEDGTGRQNLVLSFHGSQDPDVSGDITHPLGTNQGQEVCIAFTQNQDGDVLTGNVAPALGTNANATGRNTAKIMCGGVRRLTPRECERLQGFPDDYTLIPKSGPFAKLPQFIIDRSYGRYLRRMARQGGQPKPIEEFYNSADGPRYKALGNSMAVPVMRWIGKRIDDYERRNKQGSSPE